MPIFPDRKPDVDALANAIVAGIAAKPSGRVTKQSGPSARQRETSARHQLCRSDGNNPWRLPQGAEASKAPSDSRGASSEAEEAIMAP